MLAPLTPPPMTTASAVLGFMDMHRGGEPLTSGLLSSHLFVFGDHTNRVCEIQSTPHPDLLPQGRPLHFCPAIPTLRPCHPHLNPLPSRDEEVSMGACYGVVQMSPQREKGAEDPPQLPGGVKVSRLLQLRAGQGLSEREDPCVAADGFRTPHHSSPRGTRGRLSPYRHRGRRDSCTDPRLCKGLHWPALVRTRVTQRDLREPVEGTWPVLDRPADYKARGTSFERRMVLSRVTSGMLWTTLVAAINSSDGSLLKSRVVEARATARSIGQT